MSEIMTIEEVSEYTRLSRGMLAQLRYTGKGPDYFKPSAKSVLYDRADVDAWMSASRRKGTSDRVAA